MKMKVKDLLPIARSKKDISVREQDRDHPFWSLRRDIDRMFDQFLEDSSLTPFDSMNRFSSPRLDIKESEKEIKIIADLPGLDEKDIDISIRDDVLHLKGEKRQEKEEKGENYYRRERSYGSFQRDIVLPSTVESDKTEAVFIRGVLTITLPKKADSKQKSKRIEIKTT
jgi:HSP20 family protein